MYGGQFSEQATLSAGQSGIGYKRARDIAAPAHLGALIAGKPRIQAIKQDAVTVGLLPKQPLESCPAAVIETATSTYLEAPDGEDRATAKLHVQKAAQAVDESWQQTVDGHNGPVVTNATASELERPVRLLKIITAMIWIFLRRLGRACLSRHEAPEVYSAEELRHAETNPTCEIHESYCTSHQNSRPESIARINLPR